jgi:glycosyltransferase involved in cell wall biosynthesis
MAYSEEEIRRMVRQLGLGERVLLRLCYIPEKEVSAIFDTCDAVIFPYRGIYTGGTGPLMKGACTYGRPVIATKVSEMESLVRTHKIGFLAEPDDPESLAAAMVQFMDLPVEARKAMGENSADLARSHSWSAVATRYVGVFETVARR